MWDYRLDFLYRIRLLSLDNADLYGGPRYVRYTTNFKFIGGNEDFDVTSRQWGLGVGLSSGFPMDSRSSLIDGGGGDYYFSSTLAGHDTAYSPDGEHRNGRKDFGYEAADAAIDQPEIDFQILIGVQHEL